MSSTQLLVHVAPMFVVAWARTFSLVLPGLIETYCLSLDEAALCVSVLECGGFVSMLILGLVVDRLGAIRLLASCLALGSAAMMLSAIAPSYELLLLFFFLLGAGTASTASAVNALMAATGLRRSFYLGIAHSAFGLCSVIAPLIAGAIIAHSDWQTYYGLVGLGGMSVALLFQQATKPARAAWYPSASDQNTESILHIFRRISLVCLGVSTLVGVQGLFNSWSYLYVVDRFKVDHTTATLAPASIWGGILIGRAVHTELGRRLSPRLLLVASCLTAACAAQLAGLSTSFWQAVTAFVGVGIGVGGAYQLGTAWAAERVPHRIGTASTFIMASAALGAGMWPWIGGFAFESVGFSSLPWIVFSALTLGGLAFTIRRS